MIFLDVPNLDSSNYPYSVVYDCGEIDYLLCSCRTKSRAKQNRKKFQHLFNKKLKIIQTDTVRSRGVLTDKTDTIIDIKKPEFVIINSGDVR
jgi:hypothetical protein